jgi:hypothetical protein
MSDQLTAYKLAEPETEQLALCVLVKTKEPQIEWHCVSRTGEQLAEYLAKVGYVAREISGGPVLQAFRHVVRLMRLSAGLPRGHAEGSGTLGNGSFITYNQRPCVAGFFRRLPYYGNAAVIPTYDASLRTTRNTSVLPQA